MLSLLLTTWQMLLQARRYHGREHKGRDAICCFPRAKDALLLGSLVLYHLLAGAWENVQWGPQMCSGDPRAL